MKKFLVLVLVAAVSLFSSQLLFAEEGETIKIGAIFSVTGRTAFLGTPEKETVEMLVEQINANGGINGKKLEVIIYDTEGDASKAVNFATKLIEEDNVIGIIGPTLSGTSLAIVDLANENEIPLISCAASIKITEPAAERKWVFKTAQSDRTAVLRIYNYLKEKGIEKIALLTVANAFGKSGQMELEKTVMDYGFTVVSNETFDPEVTDIKPQLTKIKGKNPDAIICWGTNPGPAYVARNMKELGMETLLVQSHGVASKQFIALAGDASEGIVLPAGKLLVADKLDDNDPQKVVLLKYKKDFTDKYDKAPDTFGGHGYDALMIMVKAIEQVGADKAKIRDAIEGMTFVGISGVFQFSAEEHNGLTEDAFAMITIKDGEWALLE
ncbi:MAG: ABC transporter substrate-binding protein [Candidatus Aureabacteria bacterium]|nr:ABC transporter substrate-binding protein [Candidatus Auribacterota bacterium]